MSNPGFPSGSLSQTGDVPMTGTSCPHGRGSSWRCRRSSCSRRSPLRDRDLERPRLAVAGVDRRSLRARGRQRRLRSRCAESGISGAFFAVVLAMVLLGPAPAAAIGAGSRCWLRSISRRPWTRRSRMSRSGQSFRGRRRPRERTDARAGRRTQRGPRFAGGPGRLRDDERPELPVIAGSATKPSPARHHGRTAGRSTSRCCRPRSRPRSLTATVAYGYGHIGIGAVALAAVVLVVFQYLSGRRRAGI